MYKPIHGYTKEKIIKTIQTRMLDHPSVSEHGEGCVFFASDGNHCAIGCFLPEVSNQLKDVFDIIDACQDYKMPLQFEGMSNLMQIHDSKPGDNSDRRPRLIKWVEENVE